MIAAQPQLLQIPLDPGDVVYTPDWVAKDMVEFFKPSGRILEPCKGDGVFLKYLPEHTEWCEIQEGRDFFKWSEPVDWVFGNPPYAAFGDFMNHTMRVAENICYLMPFYSIWNSLLRIKAINKWGGVVHTRVYGYGSQLFKQKFSYPTGAIHFQRGYTGPMYTTIYDGAQQ